MTMLDTYDHRDFAVDEISRKLRSSVSVVIPTRNAASTIGSTVAALDGLVSGGLVAQILVVDADSPDGTAEAAARAGAEVLSENELFVELGPCQGKGDAMWRALARVTGEIVVFLDGDIADFGPHYVTGLLGPMVDPEIRFVKGSYRRPFRQGESEEPTGGGRVTELVAKPLLDRLVPELLGFDQPLAGELAARRTLLESIPFCCGYGVEIAMLIDVWAQVGVEGMAQVFLGTKRNAHQSLDALGSMSSQVIAALSDALDRIDRGDTGRIEAAPGAASEVTVRPAVVTASA